MHTPCALRHAWRRVCPLSRGDVICTWRCSSHTLTHTHTRTPHRCSSHSPKHDDLDTQHEGERKPQRNNHSKRSLTARIAVENAHLNVFKAAHATVITRLRNEIDGYLDVAEDVDLETLENGFYYRTVRSQAGNAVFLRARRREDGSRGAEEVVLDMDAVARRSEYALLGIVAMSPDPAQRFVAFTVDRTGDESFELHVCRVGQTKPMVTIPHVVNAVWAPYVPGEPLALYYTQADESKTAYRACRHVMGTSVKSDEEVLSCSDRRFFVDVNASKDNKLVTVHVADRDNTRVFLVECVGSKRHRASAEGETTAPVVYARLDASLASPGSPAPQYYVSHREGNLYVVWRDAKTRSHHIGRIPVQSVMDGRRPCEPHFRDAVLASISSPAAVHETVLRPVEVMPPPADTIIDDMDIFRDGIVVYARTAGRPALITACDDAARPEAVATIRRVELPPGAGSITPGTNSDYASQVARLTIATPVAPPLECEVNLSSASLRIVKGRTVGVAPGRPLFVASDYVTYTLHAPASKGARIPVTIVHRSDLGIDRARVEAASEDLCANGALAEDMTLATEASQLLDWTQEKRIIPTPGNTARHFVCSLFSSEPTVPDGTFRKFTQATIGSRAVTPADWRNNNPVLLHAYGAYGTPLDASFAPERLPLLSRGFIAAFAHVRGGGEFGVGWYHAGRGMQKMTTMLDALACARMLVLTDLTRASLLATRTESAGALVGAFLANQHPTLCRAHVLNVPFLDVVGAMSDPDLPLTQPEFVEWGDPRDPQALKYIQGYCPTHNVRATGGYPHVLTLAAEADVRAPAVHALEFVHRVRKCVPAVVAGDTFQHTALCAVHDAAGHFGAGSRDDRLAAHALEQAFVLHALGLELPTDVMSIL